MPKATPHPELAYLPVATLNTTPTASPPTRPRSPRSWRRRSTDLSPPGRSAGLDVAAVLDVDEGALVVEDVVSVRKEVAARWILALIEPDGDAVGVTFPDEQGDQPRNLVVG